MKENIRFCLLIFLWLLSATKQSDIEYLNNQEYEDSIFFSLIFRRLFSATKRSHIKTKETLNLKWREKVGADL